MKAKSDLEKHPYKIFFFFFVSWVQRVELLYLSVLDSLSFLVCAELSLIFILCYF